MADATDATHERENIENRNMTDHAQIQQAKNPLVFPTHSGIVELTAEHFVDSIIDVHVDHADQIFYEVKWKGLRHQHNAAYLPSAVVERIRGGIAAIGIFNRSQFI